MVENLFEIPEEHLMAEVQNMMYNEYRFITATCVDNGDGSFDILYHFDKDLKMKHLRICVKKDQEIPSISKIYFSAILVENEMKELFGVKIANIAVDYGGHMLLAEDELNAPMARNQIVIEKREGGKNA